MIIDEKEMQVAEEEALTASDTYTHIFKKPFTFDGIQYEKITFNFGKLTGKDSLAVENELSAMNKPVVIREISAEYQLRIAARCSDPKVGIDVLKAMPLKDCNSILNKVRSFLMAAE